MDQSQDDRIEILVAKALLDLAQIRISKLKSFYDEGEMHFSIGLDDLKDRTDHLTSEESDKFEDYYLGQRDDLKELMELKKHFSIVGLFTAFEMFLRRTLLLLHHGDTAMSECIRKMRFDDMKEKFSSIGMPIADPGPDWKAIMGIKEVRNCITHSGSRPGKKMVQRLKDYDFHVSAGVWMELPDGYFGVSADLVERACERITKDCQNALKEEHIRP